QANDTVLSPLFVIDDDGLPVVRLVSIYSNVISKLDNTSLLSIPLINAYDMEYLWGIKRILLHQNFFYLSSKISKDFSTAKCPECTNAYVDMSAYNKTRSIYSFTKRILLRTLESNPHKNTLKLLEEKS